jgi:pimeloyl-ACP methyl ester carboxylesterase
VEQSRYLDIDGPVYVAELGGEGEPIVCVHGLGGSHVNWVPAAAGLQQFGSVSAIDLPGFGLTPPAGRSTTVEANRRVLDRYLRLLGQPVTLIGNSMGGAIALRQAARAPETVSRLVLVSPAAPWDLVVQPPDPLAGAMFAMYAVPGLAELVMWGRRNAMTPEEIARWVLDLCAAHPERIPRDVFEMHVRLAEQRQHIPGIDEAFIRAARSIVFTTLRQSAYDREVAAVAVPTLVVHGAKDRLVPALAARRLGALRPDWRVEILDEVGHIAMLEDVDTFVGLVGEFGRSSAAA